jgi:hypothetical protein
MNIQQLREAAEYTMTFRETVSLNVRPLGIAVEAYQDGYVVEQLRSWADLESTRQLNPLTYLIDETVKTLRGSQRGLEG